MHTPWVSPTCSGLEAFRSQKTHTTTRSSGSRHLRLLQDGNYAELLEKWMELDTFSFFLESSKKIRSGVISFKLHFRIWFLNSAMQQPQNKKVLLSQRTSEGMWLSEPQCCSLGQDGSGVCWTSCLLHDMMLELEHGILGLESYWQNTAPWAWTYIQADPRKYSIKHLFALKCHLSRYLGASLRTLSRSRISMYRKNCTGQRTLCSLAHGNHAFRLHMLRRHRP